MACAYICWFVAILTLPSLHAASLPTSFYVMQGNGKTNVSDAVINSPKLTGFHLREGWDLLQPTRGSINYSYFDSQLARAKRLNKHVTLGVYAGVLNDPSWGNSITDFTSLITALGARYNSNPLIDAVHMAAPQVTNNSMEMYLPPNSHFTDSQIVSLWKASINAYATAFPDKTLVLDLAMVPDSRGRDTQQIDEYARQILGSNFEAIICNLKAGTSLTAPAVRELQRLHNEGVRIGGEMVSNSSEARFGGSFQTALNKGAQIGMEWYQVYQQDVGKLPATFASEATPEPATGQIAIAGFIIAAAWRRRD